MRSVLLIALALSAGKRLEPALARKTRTCSYDRSGVGDSDIGTAVVDVKH